MKYVCFLFKSKPNEVFTTDQILGKNGYDLLSLANQNPGTFLYITTPLYSEAIPLDKQPLDICPNLSLNFKPGKYEKPPYFISFCEDNNFFTLFIKVNASNYNDIPNFQTKFPIEYKDSLKLTGQDVLNQICDSFGLEITNPSSPTFKLTDNSKKIISMGYNQPLIFNCTLTEKALKRIQHHTQILEEIIQTENTYISDLKKLVEYWEDKFKASKIFSKNEMVALFREIPGILQCHSMFFNALQQRKSLYSTQVSDIFLDFSDFFKVSLQYISNYDMLLNIIQSKLANKNSNKVFMDESNGRDFASYLITPIQRMPRYRLFIRELATYTPKSHPDAPFIEGVYEKIHNVTSEMDEATEKAEKLNSLFTIQKKIGKQYNVIESFRTLKMVSNVTCDKAPCSFYIFSDIVMLNAIDRFLSGETVLFVSKISEFKYFPSVNFLTFYLKKKLKVVLFESLAEFSQVVTTLEKCRSLEYEKGNLLLSSFLWSNPLLIDPLPSLDFISGVNINNFYYFLGDSSLIQIDLDKSAVKITESPISSRVGYSMSLINKKIYIFGGKNEKLHEYYNDTWEFEIDTNHWTQLTTSSNPTPRCEHSSVISDNKLFVFGGRYKKHYYNHLFVLDLNTFEWSDITTKQSPNARSLHSACLYKDQMIIYGGKSSKGGLNDIYIYNILNNSWKALYVNLSIIPKRYGHRSVIINDYLFVIGGIKSDCNVSEKPLVLKCNAGYQVVEYESAGNNPLLLSSFGLCVDSKRNMLIAYVANSLFRIQLPSEIEDALPQMPTIAVKERSLTIDAAKRVKQRKSIQTFGVNQQETEQIIQTFGNKKLELNQIKQLHLMTTDESQENSQETTESSKEQLLPNQNQTDNQDTLTDSNSPSNTNSTEIKLNDTKSTVEQKSEGDNQKVFNSLQSNETNSDSNPNQSKSATLNHPKDDKITSNQKATLDPKNVNLQNKTNPLPSKPQNLPKHPPKSISLPEMNKELTTKPNNQSQQLNPNQIIKSSNLNTNKSQLSKQQQNKPPLPPKKTQITQIQQNQNQTKPPIRNKSQIIQSTTQANQSIKRSNSQLKKPIQISAENSAQYEQKDNQANNSNQHPQFKQQNNHNQSVKTCQQSFPNASEQNHLTQPISGNQKSKDTLPNQKSKDSLPNQKSKDSLPNQKSKDSLPNQKSKDSLPAQKSKDSLPAQKSKDSLPNQKSKDSLPNQKSKDSLPNQKSKDSLPNQKSKDSLPNQKSKDSLPAQKSKDSLPNQKSKDQINISHNTIQIISQHPKKSNSVCIKGNQPTKESTIKQPVNDHRERSSTIQSNHQQNKEQQKRPPPRSASHHNQMTEQAINQIVDYTSKFVPGMS